MGEASTVAKIDCVDELLEIFCGGILFELSLGDFCKQLIALYELHDKEDFGLYGHNFLQFHYIGMTNKVHNRDFLLSLLYHAMFHQQPGSSVPPCQAKSHK